MRQRADAVAFLGSFAGTLMPISVVNAMEMVVGAKNGRDLADIRSFLSTYFSTLPVTPSASLSAPAFLESFNLSHGLEMALQLYTVKSLSIGNPVDL